MPRVLFKMSSISRCIPNQHKSYFVVVSQLTKPQRHHLGLQRCKHGEVKLCWYQGGGQVGFFLGGPRTPSDRGDVSMPAPCCDPSSGWQVHLSSRGQQGFREGTWTVNLQPLKRTGVILARSLHKQMDVQQMQIDVRIISGVWVAHIIYPYTVFKPSFTAAITGVCAKCVGCQYSWVDRSP